MSTPKKTNQDTTKTIKIEGTLKSAFTHIEKNEDGTIKSSSNVIKLLPEVESPDGVDVWGEFAKLYEHTADKWTPQWYKEKTGITLKSTYNIPVQLVDEDAEDYQEIASEYDKCIISFDKFVQRGKIADAHVVIKCNVRESAMYPSAVRIISDGHTFDPFADF